jgi:large subunit ribosomal protein L25
MKSVALQAFPRSLNKRIGTKKVRANGRIPAVIYGRHNKPENLEIVVTDLEHVVHGSVSETVLVDLSVGGNKRLALVKDIQHHPLSGKALHLDLHEVVANEMVTINVPVETVGEAVGVKTGGGVLEHVLFKLKVRGMPKDLPEVISIDVSKMEIGHSIHIGQIEAPSGVEILGNKEIPVVSVAAPLSEAQETAAAEAATAGQPEMIKEKKEEGVADGGAKPAAGAAKAAEKAPAAGAEKKPAEKKK